MNKPTEPKKIPLTPENLVKHGVLTQDNIDIFFDDTVDSFIVVSGKSTGKTFPVIIKIIYNMVSKPYHNAFGFRKFEKGATSKMGKYFSYGLSILRLKGFDLGNMDWKQSNNYFYRLKHKQNMNKNQSVTFGSLEKPTESTDGMAPANGGYEGDILYDEPVVKEDVQNPEKIPSVEKWEEDITIIRDNLSRFNSAFQDIFGLKEEPPFQEYFLMNDWGDHPLCIEANGVMPVEEFQEFNFGFDINSKLGNYEFWKNWFKQEENIDRLLNNHTLIRIVKRKKYIRRTKFSNPINLKPNKINSILSDVFKALIAGNMNALAISLGYRHEGDSNSDMLVYNISNFNHATPEELKIDGWIPTAISYSIDVDTTRVFTITPVIKYVKYYTAPLGVKPKVSNEVLLIDKQIEMPAYGSGENGEMNQVYVKQISMILQKHYKNWAGKKSIISVDDNTKWFLKAIKDTDPIPGATYKPFNKQGDFNIEARQEWTELGFGNGRLRNHPANKGLEQDIKVCIKEDYNKAKRKTAGRTNYLDRIDSMENGFIPFLGSILRGGAKWR